MKTFKLITDMVWVISLWCWIYNIDSRLENLEKQQKASTQMFIPNKELIK